MVKLAPVAVVDVAVKVGGGDQCLAGREAVFLVQDGQVVAHACSLQCCVCGTNTFPDFGSLGTACKSMYL